jgi:hypothetical protein
MQEGAVIGVDHGQERLRSGRQAGQFGVAQGFTLLWPRCDGIPATSHNPIMFWTSRQDAKHAAYRW